MTGPDDGPGKGLGEGGERLHWWVFGGPWTYEEGARGEPTGVDKQLLDEAFARAGAGTTAPAPGAARTRSGCRSSS